MLYLTVKFIHLISVMVYFGVPVTFGRWFASCLENEDRAALAAALDKMKRFALIHLNGACLVIIGSGLWLGLRSSQMQTTWVLLALVLTSLTLINLNANLVPVLARHRQGLEIDRDRSVRARIAVFSALHHSLVTAAAALMIFRPG
jgi:uncharacterized membrane protein